MVSGESLSTIPPPTTTALLKPPPPPFVCYFNPSALSTAASSSIIVTVHASHHGICFLGTRTTGTRPTTPISVTMAPAMDFISPATRNIVPEMAQNAPGLGTPTAGAPSSGSLPNTRSTRMKSTLEPGATPGRSTTSHKADSLTQADTVTVSRRPTND